MKNANNVRFYYAADCIFFYKRNGQIHLMKTK